MQNIGLHKKQPKVQRSLRTWAKTTPTTVNTQSLEISDDMTYIIVNKEKKLFLRFDNQDLTGNRILVFFSDVGDQIMSNSKEWHIDGTFKNCPKIFLQLMTIQCIIKNIALNAAYIIS